MTSGEVLEMLFKVRFDGQADVDKMAASVKEAQGSAASCAQTLTGLEQSIQQLTAAVTENSTALAAQERGFDGAAGGATRLAGGARAATAELKMMEGAMPIRAAGQFLSQIQGLNTVMSAMFPIFGAVALVGVLDTILEKTGLMPKHWDEVAEAQKSSLDLLQKSSREYDQHIQKLKQIRLEQFELAHGKDARRALEAQELRFQAGTVDKQDIDRLEKQVEALKFFSTPTTKKASSDQRFYAGLAGLSSAEDDNLANAKLPFGLNGESYGSRQEAAKKLLPSFEWALSDARARKQEDEGEAGVQEGHIAADQKKKADEDAKKRKQELGAIEKEASAALRSAQTFELTGLAKIGAAHQERLDKMREQIAVLGQLTAAEKARYDASVGKENQAYGIETKRELGRIIEENRKNLGKYVDQMERDEEKSDRFGAKTFLANLKKEIEQESKDIASGLKVLQSSDDSDAAGVRRALQTTVKGNALAVRGGSMSGGTAANADYAVRAAAAEEIFRIETQHLTLIDDKDKREEKLATARKKYADEIYQAESQYETQLASLRERDLQKYQGMAGSIFDALRGHSMGQWFSSFLQGQGKQVFENFATPVLQNAGHALGGMIPNISIPGFGNPLRGTIFDNANADPAKQTATNTGNTAKQVELLRGDLKGVFTGNPNPDAPVNVGAGASSLSNNPLLRIFGSDLSGWTGNGPLGTGSNSGIPGASSLFNAGNGSGFSQFFSGLAGMGSNPLQAVFSGMSTNGGTVTQLTAAQQAGAAVGTAAMLAGAGMSIASGISQGGVAGYGKAAASGLGAAAMLDPEPISKSILGAVAGITGMITSMFGTGPQQRQKDITEALAKNQYLAPTALNVMQGMNGTYEDFDARGNLRTSSMSAVPTVAEPYITSRVINGQRQYYDVPGQTTAPYSGGASGNGQAPVASGPTVIIQAMDAQSFTEFADRNHHALGEAVASHLERHDGRLSNGIRYISGN